MSLLAVGLSMLLVPVWVVMDEFVLNWTVWLPGWPSLISNGLVPLALVLLALTILDELVGKIFKMSFEEKVIFMFVFLLVAFLILTFIGIFFRGPGMGLFWPWEITNTH